MTGFSLTSLIRNNNDYHHSKKEKQQRRQQQQPVQQQQQQRNKVVNFVSHVTVREIPPRCIDPVIKRKLFYSAYDIEMMKIDADRETAKFIYNRRKQKLLRAQNKRNKRRRNSYDDNITINKSSPQNCQNTEQTTRRAFSDSTIIVTNNKSITTNNYDCNYKWKSCEFINTTVATAAEYSRKNKRKDGVTLKKVYASVA